MTVTPIRFEKFTKEDYSNLISWIDNEEDLMQFGGPLFQFPLTSGQLDLSVSDPNRIAFSIVSNDTNTHIGHAEIYVADHSARLGRILIGDKQYRGKGLCRQNRPFVAGPYIQHAWETGGRTECF